MDTQTQSKLPSWLPLVVGTLFVALFTALGAWQISRGLEKRADENLFRGETSYASWKSGMAVRPHQRLKATGRFDTDHQILLDNITNNSRYGAFVITPLIGLDGEPVLLVNRGWIEKGPNRPVDASQLEVPTEPVTVRGRAGRLPRAGMKMGEGFAPGQGWPKIAVYPSSEEVEAVLGREVQPFVLLLDEGEALGFDRKWEPSGFGPDKHFGYALQWFAMGMVLSVLLIWNHRRKKFK